MVSKTRHKEKVHTALDELDKAVNSCSREVPRTVARALDALREAVEDKVLYAEEENTYKVHIADKLNDFERKCSCIKR